MDCEQKIDILNKKIQKLEKRIKQLEYNEEKKRIYKNDYYDHNDHNDNNGFYKFISSHTSCN